jgi:hypothetical protein
MQNQGTQSHFIPTTKNKEANMHQIRMGARDQSKDTAINTYLTSAFTVTGISVSKYVSCILFVGVDACGLLWNTL